MNLYWEWWLGGLALALVPICYGKKSFGVSGALEKVLYKKETIDIAESDIFSKDEEAIKASLAGKSIDAEKSKSFSTYAKKSWLSNLLLIIGITSGAFLESQFYNTFNIQYTLGQTHEELFGSSIKMVFILFTGGLFIGIGTRLAGGCTSGHGLSGCGRFDKYSILSTAVFFGTAIATTFILNNILGVT